MWAPTNDQTARIVFATEAHSRGYGWQFSESWATEATLPDLDGTVFTRVEAGSGTRVVERDEWLAHLHLWSGSVYLEVAAESEGAGRDAIALFREHLPEQASTETTVPVTFWFDSPDGPAQKTRRVAVAPWQAVRGNYPARTAQDLDRLMTGFVPSAGGQLMLWQGLPGTGKTHALRALASEWRGWADMHYIVDPDNLFGHAAHYLITVLLSGTDGTAGPDDPGERWKVLVLEDTGELLAADAKMQTGQALSRLLNVVDGLIGQGLRVLVLVTTNEELKTLHPAVARPGRCAAQVTFEPLDRQAAARWLTAHGRDDDGAGGAMTLAELYARLDERRAPERQPVGFRG